MSDEKKKQVKKKEEVPFNPALNTEGLKQWWAAQVKKANKTVTVK